MGRIKSVVWEAFHFISNDQHFARRLALRPTREALCPRAALCPLQAGRQHRARSVCTPFLLLASVFYSPQLHVSKDLAKGIKWQLTTVIFWMKCALFPGGGFPLCCPVGLFCINLSRSLCAPSHFHGGHVPGNARVCPLPGVVLITQVTLKLRLHFYLLVIN